MKKHARFLFALALAAGLVIAFAAHGAVTDLTNRRDTTGDGSTKAFTFTFPAQKTSDIEIFLNGVKQTSGYTVTLAASPSTGGTVTFTNAPTSNAAVRIQRTAPFKQECVSPSTAKITERCLDARAMVEQQLDRRITDHETTADSIAAAANSATPVTAAGSSVPRRLDELFRDRYSVLSFIPANLHEGIRLRTDNTDLTAYFNLALGVVRSGTLYVPSGHYNHTGLTFSYPVNLECEGWDYQTGGATLHNTSSVNHGISITMAATTGARIFNCHIRGNSDTDPATQASGIYVHSEGDNLIEHNYITHAKHGIELYGHTSALKIISNRIQSNLYDGIYARTEAARQINAILIAGNESTFNGRHGINVWGNSISIVGKNTIQGNTGAGVYLNADDMATANASSYAVKIDDNYFEANNLGAIKALATDNPPTYHYLQGLWITNNFITEPHALSTTVTAAIDLDCGRGGGNRCYSGSYAYDGVVVADNLIGLIATIAYVDFHNVQGRRTVLTPHYGSYSTKTTFATQYLGMSGVYVKDAVYRVTAGAPTESADFIGQTNFDSGSGTWTRSRSAGLGSADWLSGASPVLQIAQDPNLISSTDALDNTGVWFATTALTVTPDVDGVADAVFVATNGNASLNQQYIGVVAGESYRLAFDAKNNNGTVASLAVYDSTNGAYIVPVTSYFSRINGSSYSRVLTTFQIPAGCTQIQSFVAISPSLAGATNVLIKAVALNKLSVNFARFAAGSVTILNGQQTITSDLSSYEFTSAPACTVTGVTTNAAYKVTTTTTLLTVDAGGAVGTDTTIKFTCIGQ